LIATRSARSRPAGLSAWPLLAGYAQLAMHAYRVTIWQLLFGAVEWSQMFRSPPGNSPRTTFNPACHVFGDEPDRVVPQHFSPRRFIPRQFELARREGGEAF
jgi:hypothetical protein